MQVAAPKNLRIIIVAGKSIPASASGILRNFAITSHLAKIGKGGFIARTDRILTEALEKETLRACDISSA
jgi:hypothetical protein